MNDYDIKKIYEEMELHLISSMKRNLGKHLKDEIAEGKEWKMWQAEKLKEIKRYQRQNKDIIGAYTSGLDKEIADILKEEFKQGHKSEIDKYKKLFDKKVSDSFFKLNDRKANALIKVVNEDLNKANTAALRMMNDVYRQTIHKAATFASNGVMTQKQAVDMATKDFLSRGLNVIEYADGKRVNIASYSQMAVRTASQRAMLMGEGEFRKSIGETLVIISKHGTACKLCQPHESKVYIDDVYSGGKPDGKHKLLSDAMDQGLFHPNCRHGISTYYGLDDEEEETTVNVPKENNNEDVTRLDREIQKEKRKVTGFQSPDNLKTAQQRLRELEAQKQYTTLDLYYGYSYKNNNQIKLYNVSSELPEGIEVAEKGGYLSGEKVKVKATIKNPLEVENQKDIRNIIMANNADAKKIYDEMDKISESIDKESWEYIEQHKLYDKKSSLLANIREMTDKYLKDNNYDSIHIRKDKKYILFNSDNVKLSDDTYINIFTNDYDYKTFADELINNNYLTDDFAKSRGFMAKGEDLATKKLLKDKGYDNKPSILSNKEFDDLSDNEYIKLYRGVVDNETVTAKQINDQFINGELYIGNGLFGNGTYTAENKFVGMNYAKDKAENVLEMAISKNAKIVNVKELKDDLWISDGKSTVVWDIGNYTKTLGLNNNQQRFLHDLLKDETFVAVNKGYDVIKIDPEDWLKILHDKDAVIAEAQKAGEELKPYYLILNRGIVKVKGA